jgi:hypothetical protein
MEAIVAARAKHNKEARTNQHSSLSTDSSKGSPIDTPREIAKKLGVSEGTTKVKKIDAHAVADLTRGLRQSEPVAKPPS